MKKIVIDTNVILRFVLNDDKNQLSEVKKLFEAIEEGQFQPYISSIILLEIHFVLTKIYKFSFDEVGDVFDRVMEMRNLTIIEKTHSIQAVEVYKKYKIKMGDCLIATQIPKGGMLVTFDKDFSKIKNLLTQTPAGIV